MDVGYGSVRKMAARECTRRGGVKLKTCSLLPLLQSLAMDTNAVVEHVRQSMTPRTRVVVFDHVTSNTALQLPVAKLVRLCREHGVFSVVDGAHSLGSISRLNVEEIGADFFCGNLHKWWCNVRGCGFLHVRADAPELHPCVEPPVVSHGYGEGGMASDFLWQGAGDYAPMLAVTATAEWWGPQGVELAISRNRELLSAAAHLLSGAWQTRTLLPTGSPLSANTMSLVQVPMPRRGAHAHTSADGKALQDALFRQGIECPIKTIDGELYVRISAGVYNQLHEYQRLANEVRKIISKADTLD
uniref:Aminotransferase class V domain-containing protein n=1 Tax=Chrysotila carterae TaxID=13221 RepID=A0A7S4FCK6_CHRCT